MIPRGMEGYGQRGRKSTPSRAGGLTRRGFLAGVAASAGWAALRSAGPVRAALAAADSPYSVVALCRDEQVIQGLFVRARLMRDLVDQTVKMTAGRQELAEAWGAFVRPGQKLLLKFAALIGGDLGTSLPMLEALLDSLEAVGHKRADIRVAGCPYAAHLPGLAALPEGWGPVAVRVGEADEPLRRYLDGVEAIINVPVPCDHSRIGVNGAMANMSLSLIRRPGRYEGEALHRAVATVCGSGAVRPRVKLTLVNALRGVYDGGPAGDGPAVAYENSVWGSADMVAIDRVMLEWLDRTRQARGLAPLERPGREPAFLAMAADLGLGQDELRWIDRRRRTF